MGTIFSISDSGDSDNWKEKTGRVGHLAKGVVYAMAGILTLLAAFNMGGEEAGTIQVLEFLQKQPFGTVLLILMAIGLGCYAFWRFVQAFQNPKNKGRDMKGKLERAGYFTSGVVYLSFAAYAIMQIFAGGGGSSGDTKQGAVASLLQNDAGVVVVIVIAIVLFGKSIYQFYRIYKGDFTKNIRSGEIPHDKATTIVKNAGYAGFAARGILIGIVAYFFLRAALDSNASAVQGSSGAFSFIRQSTSGPWLIALVAIGLICYGVFMLIAARYKRFYAP